MTNTAYPLKPIQTEADYRAALKLVAPYFENEPEIDSNAGRHRGARCMPVASNGRTL